MKKLLKISFIALAAVFVTSCSSSDDNNQQSSRIMVSMTDAPGDYEHVYIDVQDVVVKYSGSENEVSLGQINAGIYDLLELTGGISVLLADEDIPSGHITQMRLVLGSQNSIVVDGETHALQTPSAQQSGLKLNINQTLEAGVLYEFMLDFDVAESIVVQGNGSYLLKPVIRVSTLAESGSISGMVLPLGIQALVTASNGVDTISAYTNADGNFVLHGVPQGSYIVTIQPEITSGLEVVVLNNVIVTTGNITALGTITLL